VHAVQSGGSEPIPAGPFRAHSGGELTQGKPAANPGLSPVATFGAEGFARQGALLG
jgi:hypothetical protein